MSALLRNKLAEVRRRDLLVTAGLRIAQAIVAASGTLGLVMLLDRAFELPMAVRAPVALMTFLGLAAFLCHTILRLALRPPSDEHLALRVERDQPGLRQRLISTVQLSPEEGQGAETSHLSPSLIAHLVRETEALLAPADLATTVPAEPAVRWAGCASLAAVLLALAVGLTAPAGPALLGRALAIPGIELPRRTRIELLTPPATVVARGEDMLLAARAAGQVPAAGEIRVTTAGRHSSRHPVAPATRATDEFEVTLKNVTGDFTYRFHLGDNRSHEGAVRVSPRPVVTEVRFSVAPPAYTQLPATRKFPGDLTVLAGSTLSITAESSKPLASTGSTLLLRGPGGVVGRVPLRRTSPTSLAVDAVLLPPTATGISIELLDDEGLASRDSAVHPLSQIPDRPPALRLLQPTRREDLVTRWATIRIAAELSDDLGLSALAIRYTVRSAETPVGQPATSTARSNSNTLPLDLPGGLVALRTQHLLSLASLPLVEGNTLEWWLELTDTHGQTTASEHFIFRIGSEAQVRAGLLSRLNASLGALQDAQSAQQSLTQDLGQFLLQKSPETPQSSDGPSTRPK